MELNWIRRAALLAAGSTLLCCLMCGCSEGTSELSSSSEESSASESYSESETYADIIGEVIYAGSSYLSVDTYISETEIDDYAALDPDSLVYEGQTSYIYPDSSTEYYLVSDGSLTEAASDSINAGDLIAETYDENGVQQIVILTDTEAVEE